MDAAVAARWRTAVARNRRIGLDAGNDWLLLQLLEIRIFGETRNLVVAGRWWRRRNQRHQFFRQKMEPGIVHRTPSVATSAPTSAVTSADRPELDQRPNLLVMRLADLLVDEGQGRNDSAVHGHQIVLLIRLFHHHRDVVNANCGRLFPVRQEIRRHFSFALHFDSSAALELVRLVFQHLVNLFRHLIQRN